MSLESFYSHYMVQKSIFILICINALYSKIETRLVGMQLSIYGPLPSLFTMQLPVFFPFDLLMVLGKTRFENDLNAYDLSIYAWTIL